MTSKEYSNKAVQNVREYPQYLIPNDDEIDLRELVSIVIDGWKWLVFTPLVAVAIAFLVDFTSTPSYTTSFQAEPASQLPLLVSNNHRITLDAERLYSQYVHQLASFEHFSHFSEQNPELAFLANVDTQDERELLALFNRRFTVADTGNEDAPLLVEHHYSGDEPGVAALNAYLHAAAERTWHRATQQLDFRNASTIRRLEHSIELQKTTLRAVREERIFALQQAVEIARELDIELPTTPQDYGWQPNGNEVFYANIGSENALPLYFMGYRALEAEQTTLETGLDTLLNDAFIRREQQRLREHLALAQLIEQGELENLLGLMDVPAIERLVNVINYPLNPASETGLGTKLLLLLAAVVGGFLGLIMTFIAHFARSVRRYRLQQPTR
ncbi:MAG: Wzz/FepE/Etk N-terminal domain-containing protein [Natronospirillum sp.]